jgi:hypothetical protein
MTDQERAERIYDLQEIARERDKLAKSWIDRVIAEMELEFI